LLQFRGRDGNEAVNGTIYLLSMFSKLEPDALPGIDKMDLSPLLNLRFCIASSSYNRATPMTKAPTATPVILMAGMAAEFEEAAVAPEPLLLVDRVTLLVAPVCRVPDLIEVVMLEFPLKPPLVAAAPALGEFTTEETKSISAE